MLGGVLLHRPIEIVTANKALLNVKNSSVMTLPYITQSVKR